MELDLVSSYFSDHKDFQFVLVYVTLQKSLDVTDWMHHFIVVLLVIEQIVQSFQSLVSLLYLFKWGQTRIIFYSVSKI